MDESNILLYSLLKGFPKASQSLSVPPDCLFTLLKSPSNFNSQFFDRILEILKLSLETMGLSLSCGYFSLSPEMYGVFTNPEQESKFLQSAKEFLSKKHSETRFPPESEAFSLPQTPRLASIPDSPSVRPEPSVHMVGEHSRGVPHWQGRGARPFAAAPVLYPQTPQGMPFAVRAAELGRGLAQASPTPSPAQEAMARAKNSNSGSGAEANLVNNSGQPRSAPVQTGKRLLNPAALPEYRPQTGSLFNPDYSFMPHE
jgi:hypothetical protein